MSNIDKNFRIGNGFDLHPLVPQKKLVIGGKTLEHPQGLGFKGHSDGDILVHAICDALLGGAGLKDIGTYFSDSDSKWSNAYSLEAFLVPVLEMIKEKKYSIANIDATVILDEPKLMPHIGDIKKNLADKLEINMTQISIKATRSEGCLFQLQKPAGIAMVSTLLF